MSTLSQPCSSFPRRVRPLGLRKGWGNPQLRPLFPKSELRVPFLSGRGQTTLLRVTTSPPPGPYPSRERGAWPERQGPSPWPCAAERRAWRSPLCPSLERGPHQSPELGFLGLSIGSLTAPPAFRHLVRSPGSAGPDIRLAHSVCWPRPRTHARTCACPKPHLAPRP